MKVAKFKISGNIGEPDPFLAAFGVIDDSTNAQMIGDFIDANPEADTFEIEIDSNGGSVTTGFAIHDKLINSGKKIITKGYKVNSIATVVFLAGSERLLSKNAEFVIHNPWIDGSNLGNMPLTADELDAIAEDVRNSEDKIFNFYKDSLKLNDSDQSIVRDLMSKDTDLGTQRAIDLGFATGTLERKKAKAAYTELIFNKYKSNNDNKMNIEEQNKKISLLEKGVNAILNLLKPEKKNATVTAEDGVTLYFEGDTLEVGTKVFTDEALSVMAEDGEHTLDTGEVIVIFEGTVTEIRPVEVDDNAKKIADLEAENKRLADELAAKSNDTNNEAIIEEVNKLKTEIANYKKSVAGDKRAEKKNETKTDAPLKPWEKRIAIDKANRETFSK
jgi:ATP-dependent Clp protease protease subunit